MSGFGLLGNSGAFKANLLDLRQRRQDIIAANIANADTPGYKARRLSFEEELAKSTPRDGDLPMARSDPRHLPAQGFLAASGEIQEVETPISKGDMNSVDMEQEMARQTANQLLYNYATQSLNGQITKMKMAIRGEVR
ncbi:flagellar basal-body rod protein FlgB [Magnetococcus marinus MC-1]|uniref:Flagellar basal body rod protein FlgB n=1 Tax=Magnetococcus marinus (strain ATCC BAA-1437 / JCM 17883 / MC-1) TaxID=156889 RepID=A0L4A0_MAGMM|nr:flagellar basal body rod protein FlgB [Magnetococcus marinus]ABK42793.1 flagellar basal-body rod protein FlgB [Magnetococcus marinus MC-1]